MIWKMCINQEQKKKSSYLRSNKMLKVLILRRVYNHSHGQNEFQVNVSGSFQRFFAVGAYEFLPDEKTIWLFAEMLIKEGLDKILFEKLNY